MQIASERGLEAMSLSTLADATNMSKSGLFAHFRSKEALQLAIIDEAERMFREHVVKRGHGQRGLQRLHALLSAYVQYCAGGVFRGGCFFLAAVHEFDARPGMVRERLARWLDTWNAEVAACLAQARNDGVELTLDDEQVAYEALGIGMAANTTAQMGDPDGARRRGEVAIARLVGMLAVEPQDN